MPSIYINSWYKTYMWGNMIIRSLSGKKIFETRHKRMRDTLEEAVKKGIDLSYADLRRYKFRNASLDGMIAAGASFWGADLSGSDIGYATLHGADFRGSLLKDVCFAHSNLTGANMLGSHFENTILQNTTMDRVRVSCPSFWNSDLQSIRSMIGFVFLHKGEEEFVMHAPPLIIRGIGYPLILQENICLWGDVLYRSGSMPAGLYTVLSKINTIIGNVGRQKEDSHYEIMSNLKRLKKTMSF